MIGASMPADAVSPSYLAPLPVSSLPLSRHGLDRDYLGRSAPDLFESLRDGPATRLLVLWRSEERRVGKEC